MHTVSLNDHGQSFWQLFSCSLLHSDLSYTSSLTELTSDNQRLESSNDSTSVAKHPTLNNELTKSRSRLFDDQFSGLMSCSV